MNKNTYLYLLIAVLILIVIAVLVTKHTAATVEGFRMIRGRHCASSGKFCFDVNSNNCSNIDNHCTHYNTKNRPPWVTNRSARSGRRKTAIRKCKDMMRNKCMSVQSIPSDGDRIPTSRPGRRYVVDWKLFREEFGLDYLINKPLLRADDPNVGTVRDHDTLMQQIRLALEQIEQELNGEYSEDHRFTTLINGQNRDTWEKSFPAYVIPHQGFLNQRNFYGEQFTVNGLTVEKFGAFHVNFYLSNTLKNYKQNVIQMTRVGHIFSSGDIHVDRVLASLGGHMGNGLFRLIHSTNYDKIYNGLTENDPNEDYYDYGESVYVDRFQFRHHSYNVRGATRQNPGRYNRTPLGNAVGRAVTVTLNTDQNRNPTGNCLLSNTITSSECSVTDAVYDDRYPRTFSNLTSSGRTRFIGNDWNNFKRFIIEV